MPKRNYYSILGIPKTESLQGIQRAFRRIVKRYHPDIVGPNWINQFHDIVEAYNTLSDPDRRTSYNEALKHVDEEFTSPRSVIISYDRVPEPLFPEPVNLMRDFYTASDSFDALFNRFLRNFTGRDFPKSEQLQGLTVEVVLTPAEAFRGDRLPINVPTAFPCPYCGGTGQEWPYQCSQCQGRGLVEEEESVVLSIPPGVRNNTLLEVPLKGLGIHNLFLSIHIRIGS